MAINFIKKEDLSHITRTTRQWETTIDRYEIIPKGVLCIELCNDKLTKIKIGNGHLIYEQLPYVSDVNLSDYYTKEETNTLLKNLKSIKIKGEASSLSDLPLRGNEDGDLWFVNKSDPDEHSRYDEYVWYNNKWESFGSSDIDLSEYAKKSYVDTHIQEVQNEITEIIESGYLHKHDNKNILDHTSAVYNVEKDNKLRDLHNYDDTELREKAHTHLNKNILDQTDAVYNRDKDDKLASLHNYDDTTVKDRLSSLESVAHSHSNQDILNRTTAAFTKEQALTLLDCKDFKGTDGVHDGYHGFVPAPTKDDIGKVLGANGQWVEGGSSGGDTITEGGGISITTDAQTGNKVISVNAGTGLEIDQQTGELNVTSTGGDTIAEGSGIDITTDAQTGVKTISVDIGDGLQFNQNSEIDIKTGDGLSINQNNELDINTGEGLQINQNNELNVAISNGLQFDSNDAIEVNTGDGLSINNDNEIDVGISNGLQFDSNNEIEINTGDGLSINQDNELEVNTGNGLSINNNNAIELDKATTTTIGGIIVGDNLSIDNTGKLSADEYTPGEGISIDSNKEVSVKYNSDGLSINASDELELDKATKNSIGGVIVGDNIGVSNGTISVPIATDSALGVVKPTDGLSIDNTGELYVNTGDGLSINQDNEIEINIGEGLSINQDNELEVSVGDGLSINASDEVELDKATTTTIGGVIIGGNIDVNNGTISVPKAASNKLGVVKPSDGLSVDPNGVLTVDTGDGLSIDSSTKDVNVNVGRALTINQNNDIDVNIASSSSVGVVKPTTGLQVDVNGELTLKNATTTELGGVIVGDNIDVNNGTISVPKAASNKLGVVKPTDGLSIDNTGKLSVNVGDGLSIDSTNNDVNVNTGRALSINNDNELDVNLGQALSINSDNEVDVNTGRALSINNSNEIDADIATSNSLGVIKVGSGLDIDEYGNLSTQATPYRIGRALSLDDESVRLPSGYAKAKYVANTNNAAVRINFRPSDYPNAKYTASVSVDSCGSSTSYPTRYLCGATGWTGGLRIPLDGISEGLPIKTYFYIGNGNYPDWTTTTFQFGDRFDIEASVAGGYKINNEVVQASATPPSNFGTYNLAIFGGGASNGTGSYGFIGKMYYFRIYNTDDTLLIQLVPAVRRADNVVGFYDMVGNRFYPSETSTAFTTDMDDLDVDEPDWVLNADIATAYKLGVIKPSTGLLVDEQGALSLKTATATILGGIRVGDGLSMDEYGVLSTNIMSYSSGHAIEIVEDVSIDKFRWEITENAGDSMVAFRYFEYSDENHDAFTIASGTIEWSDGSTVSFPSGYDETFAGMMENRTKCTVTGWGGDKTLIMTFTLSQSIMLSDIGYFRWKTDDYMAGRQPTEFNIYAHDSVNDEWILLKEVTDHSLVPSSGNTWSNYIEIEPEIEPGAINVKYGNGLTLNQNNELEVSIGDGLVIDEDGAVALENLPEFYLPGTAISFNPSAVLYPTEFSDVLFVQSITRIWNGSIVKADDNKSFTLTASGNDCYTCEYEPGRSGIYLFPAEASTKYRLTWTSSDDTVSGSIYAFENNGFDHIYSVDQSVLPYLEFTTSATATTLNFRFGVQNPPDSITFSNIRLYKIINDGDDEISVNYGDGLTVNQDNELEVNIGSGLQFDANGAIEVVNSGTEYTAGDGIDIDVNNEISVVTGDGIVIDENGAVALEEQPTEYRAGEAISIETVGGLQPTNYSNDDFVDSIASMNAGSIVKAADRSSFTLTASYNDCYTRGTSGQANGSYPFNVKASTKYRFAWDSADPTVHGKVYTYENGLYDAMMHEIDQYDSSYLEFTTSANTTFIQARFGVMYAGDSITYSNVRLYEVLEDEDQYDEISVKYGNGLTVNERNELEVSYGNGLALVSNSQYRPEYYFSTQVQCKVHTDNYYLSPRSFDRTFQKTTTEPALCCLWEYGSDGYRWVCPLIVGTTATSVQYTAIDLQQTVSDQNTFQYLGQTWYTSGYPISINDADHEDKLGNLQYLGAYTTTSDQIQAAKDLIDLALINAGSLQAKLGDGLTFDENDAITLDESIKLIIHCVGDPLT